MGIQNAFVNASSSGSILDVKNLLVLGASLPSQATGTSNKAVPASSFVNAAAHDYHLAAGSPAIDTGITIASIIEDRDGVTRPKGAGYDIGAYERP
jgi:hypothetical protein